MDRVGICLITMALLAGCGEPGQSTADSYVSPECLYSETIYVQGKRRDVYRATAEVPEGATVTGVYIGWTQIDLETGERYYDPEETGEIQPEIDGTTASYTCRTRDELQNLDGFYDEVRFYIE